MTRMTINPGKTTLVEEVYSALRVDLLSGVFPPGSRLKFAAFGKRFGVSLSVIREAMARLGEQGLVVANPHRGFIAAPLLLEDLFDLTRVRVLIETLALRESIEHGDLAWESRILATHHTLHGTPRGKRHVNEPWACAHREFHGALVSGSGSNGLVEIATGLRERSEMYQYWASEFGRDVNRDVAAEHRQLMEATLSRDAERATQALAEHIERTTANLVARTQSFNTDQEQSTGDVRF